VNCSTGTVTLCIVAKGPGTVLPDPDGIAERWGLAPLAAPEPLTSGHRNALLRCGDVVVRLERTDAESAAWEHELLAFLAHDVPEVVVPLTARDGSTFSASDGVIVSVLPFVAGEPLDRGDEDQRLQLARLLARLHWVGAAWHRPRPGRPSFADADVEVNAWWDWRIVDKPAVLTRAFECTRVWLAAAPALAYGAVHGDIYRGNLRVRDGRIVGLVDWEEARVDWPAWELANATWEVCKDMSRDELDRERAEHFLAAYADAGGPGERKPFEPLLRLRLLADALYSLTSKARGEPYDPGYVSHLLRALERLDA
jgi:Ser/Thr protein kinase RdoA (MazF antagonist)